MKNRNDKVQSEFEQKLRESELAAERADTPLTDADASRTAETPSTDINTSRRADTPLADADNSRRADAIRDNEVIERDTATPAATQRRNEETEYIPVVEEQVRINKKTVETGSVHVYKDVHEEEVTVDVPTVHEEVNVERVPINEYVETAPPSVRYEGDVMIIPVLHEELVLVKRLKLVEELHVTKRRVETHQAQHMTLRKEEVNVDRVDPNGENRRRV